MIHTILNIIETLQKNAKIFIVRHRAMFEMSVSAIRDGFIQIMAIRKNLSFHIQEFFLHSM